MYATSLEQALRSKKPVKSLSLYGDLDEIPSAIQKLVHLESLELGTCAAASLPNWLSSLKKLKDLSLGCSPNTLPDWLGALPELRELRIGAPKDKKLDVIATISKLESLSLHGRQPLTKRGNPLESLPKSFGKLKNLRRLRLGDTDLKDIPEVLVELPALEFLSIWGGKFDRVSPRIGKLAALDELELGQTWLRSLPDEIGKLQNLRNLSLKKTRLTELPKGLARLGKLETLTVEEGKLSRLPAGFERLEKLWFLSLGRQPIKDFPKAILELPVLKNLHLHELTLTSVPESVLDLPNLESLYLSQVPLSAECYATLAERQKKSKIEITLPPPPKGWKAAARAKIEKSTPAPKRAGKGPDGLVERLSYALELSRPEWSKRNLKPGAPASRLDAFEKKHGVKLPATFRALYGWHDGMKSESAFYLGLSWLDLKGVEGGSTMMKRIAREQKWKPEQWGAGWLPFLDNFSYDVWVLDMDGSFRGKRGQILHYSKDGDPKIMHESFDKWLETFVLGLEAELFEETDDGFTASNEQAWNKIKKKANPGYPKYP